MSQPTECPLTDQDFQAAAEQVKSGLATRGAVGAESQPVACPCTDDELCDGLRQGVQLAADHHAAAGNPVGKFDWAKALQLVTQIMALLGPLFGKDGKPVAP
jgi:hypothetical protein